MRAGKLKALAVSSDKRVPDKPGLPTVSEVLPGFIAGSYQGVFAPANTPAEVIDKIHADIVRALAAPEAKDKLATLGAAPVGNAPQQMRAFLREGLERWAKLIRELDLKIEE